MGKKQINVEVDEEIANYVKRQAHQGRYIEDLVRRDMGADDSLLRRIEVLEHAVHENHIRFDGLDFGISSSGWSSVMGHISKFRFNIKDPMENMEMQTMGDGLTLRTFAFRNSEGHFAGKARIIFKQNETNPFILDFDSISKIGGRLIVPLECKPKNRPTAIEVDGDSWSTVCAEHSAESTHTVPVEQFDCIISSCDKSATHRIQIR